MRQVIQMDLLTLTIETRNPQKCIFMSSWITKERVSSYDIFSRIWKK